MSERPKAVMLGLPKLVARAVAAIAEEKGYYVESLAAGESLLPEADVYIADIKASLGKSQLTEKFADRTLYYAADISRPNGRIFGPDTPPEWLADQLPAKTMTAGGGELSAREKDVLREIASGKTYRQVADTLFISINTVLTHRKNISAKLGIRSVAGLSLYAMMNGIMSGNIPKTGKDENKCENILKNR